MSEAAQHGAEPSGARAGWSAALRRMARAHPRAVLITLALASLAGLALAAGLRPSAGVNTFLPESSAAAKATRLLYRHFGEEPVELLVEGPLQKVLLSEDIERLLGLEGCLSGRLPAGAALAALGDAAKPCGELARMRAVKVVIGPATFVNEAALKIDEALIGAEAHARQQARQAQAAVRARALAAGDSPAAASALAEEARKATLGAFGAEVASLALRYGLTSTPAINNREFVDGLIFARSAAAGTPKPRFAYLFPSRRLAVVSVRLRDGLGEARRAEAIKLIRRIAATHALALRYARYSVTGEPVLIADLTDQLAGAVELLLVAALLVMALALGLLFDGRPRLLPLAVALCSSAIGFGIWALLGGSLSLGSLAVLPVLVGLAVDYAVQIQSGGVGKRAPVAGLAAAALASACSMLALLLSPVPLVHSFSVLLIGGIAIALPCALIASTALLSLPRRGAPASRLRRLPGRPRWRAARFQRVGAALEEAWRGARELLRDNALVHSLVAGAFALAVRRRRQTLIVGGLLAAAGLALSTQLPVQSDITKLVPAGGGSLRSLQMLERESGSGGEIEVLLHGSELARPEVVSWMRAYEQRVLSRFGPASTAARASSRTGCAQATLCPVFSLPDLLAGAQGAESSGAAPLNAREIGALLRAIPPYFSQSVISADRHYATLAFGIRLMSLERQQAVIETMRAMLKAPSGVRAQLAGVAVLTAQAAADIAAPMSRAIELLASLLIAGGVLLVAFGGNWRRTAASFLPVLLAGGWAALAGWLSGMELNPISVALSVLVIAIAIELSVLLAERYRAERLGGSGPPAALRIAYSRTAAALATSAVSAIAGFAVLALSPIRMLQGFGLATVLDLSVALVGVLLVSPSVLLALEHDRESESDPASGGAPTARRRALLRSGTGLGG